MTTLPTIPTYGLIIIAVQTICLIISAFTIVRLTHEADRLATIIRKIGK
jgi:hypothetical protein